MPAPLLPSVLPHSIIDTPEGTEGEAPGLPNDERTLAPPEEPQREEEEPALPTLAQEKPPPLMKGKKVKAKPQKGRKAGAQKQAVLPFVEKATPKEKPKPKSKRTN